MIRNILQLLLPWLFARTGKSCENHLDDENGDERSRLVSPHFALIHHCTCFFSLTQYSVCWFTFSDDCTYSCNHISFERSGQLELLVQKLEVTEIKMDGAELVRPLDERICSSGFFSTECWLGIVRFLWHVGRLRLEHEKEKEEEEDSHRRCRGRSLCGSSNRGSCFGCSSSSSSGGCDGFGTVFLLYRFILAILDMQDF